MDELDEVNGRRWGMSPTALTVSLEDGRYSVNVRDANEKIYYGPYTYEFNIDVHRECLFERRALFPSGLILTSKHLVRKRHLLAIECREKANLRGMSF